MQSSLKGIYLLEQQKDDHQFTWAFPSVDNDIVSLLKGRLNLGPLQQTSRPQHQDNQVFDEVVCHKYKNLWLYSHLALVPPPGSESESKSESQDPHTTHIAITIVSDQYNVPQFSALLKLIVDSYLSAGNTTTLLQLYLHANAHGKVEFKGKSWNSVDFNPRLALIQPTHQIPKRFGLECIILFVAVLTKLRIVVHHPNPVQLSALVRILPTFGSWHRSADAFQYIRPICAGFSNSVELNDIKNTPSCIVGVLNKTGIDLNDDLWDIFVDGVNNSIELNNKTTVTLTKYHKSIAETLVNTVENLPPDSTELDSSQLIIKMVMIKVKEILELMNQSKDDKGLVSPESLRKNSALPQNLHHFIQSVAVAENCAAK